jgi:hypothetical protein
VIQNAIAALRENIAMTELEQNASAGRRKLCQSPAIQPESLQPSKHTPIHSRAKASRKRS